MSKRLAASGISARATALAGLLMLVGALAVFVPYLTGARTVSGGVPASPALFSATEFALAPGRSACMDAVAVEPASRAASFAARPAVAPSNGGSQEAPPAGQKATGAWRPPVELSILAPGYAAHAIAPGGHGYKQLTIRIAPPGRSVIGTVCFRDVGHVGVALEGTIEPRTVSRSATTLAGTPVVGDIALAFLDTPQRSLLSSLGLIFGRASRLTEGLIPVWLVWLLSALVALGLPLCVLLALRSALHAEEPASGAVR